MAIVVSDTSPIRALAHLDCLTWLGDLFIAPALREKVLEQEGEHPAPR